MSPPKVWPGSASSLDNDRQLKLRSCKGSGKKVIVVCTSWLQQKQGKKQSGFYQFYVSSLIMLEWTRTRRKRLQSSNCSSGCNAEKGCVGMHAKFSHL